MSSFALAMAFLGVFLPVLGLAATFFLAKAYASGTKRWVVLAAGPALTLLVFIVFFEAIAAVGHMLTVAMFLGLVVFLLCYYPFLLVTGVVAWRKARTDR